MPSASSAGYRRPNSVGSTASSLYTGMTTLSFGVAAILMPPLSVRRDRALRLQRRQQFLGSGAHQIHRAARLDVEPYQGLGVRAAQVEAPILEFERHPVGTVDDDGLRRVARFEGGDGRLGVGNPVVEFAADGKQPDALVDQLRQRDARLAQNLRDDEPGNHAAVAISETPEVM